jgi:hypothetical protein
MKSNPLLLVLLFISSLASFAQVGINTTSPKGALDIVSTNQGVVIPRVDDINTVTDGQGNSPVDGTVAYDTSTNSFCFRANSMWICTDSTGTTSVIAPPAPPTFDDTSNSDYVKTSNTGPSDQFGFDVALSSDGNTAAISAWFEASNATGINGDQSNNSFLRSGAVYVYTRSGSTWTQQAYIKASNTSINAQFGFSLSLSADGNLLAVGARGDRSGSPGIGGNQNDVSQPASGAVYIFSRTGSTWAQTEYIKASNPELQDQFGFSVDLSTDGNTLAVGAFAEDSSAPGINGNQSDNSQNDSGAVYLFVRNAGVWSQEAYIKASNPGQSDQFGKTVALSSDGNTLSVGAWQERSSATGIDGNQTNNSNTASGAVYVFIRTAGSWTQEAYIKSSNSDTGDYFGTSVALSSDGNTLAVGAYFEQSLGTGINGSQGNDAAEVGAVYIFSRSAGNWTQEAYIKASNSGSNDHFGQDVALSSDGTKLAVGAHDERSNATGINGDQTDNSFVSAGAVYVFSKSSGTWVQEAYVKATNTAISYTFGYSVAFSSDGNTLAIGSPFEASNATGVNGDQNNVSATGAGAAYFYTVN